MFETRKELFSKIDAQAADIARLEADLVAAESKVSASTNADETISGLTEDLDAAKAALVELEEKSTAEITGLKAALAEAEAKVTPEAIQALVTAQIAASGHPPLNVENGSEPNGQTGDLLAQYESLKGQEKRDFLAKHAVELQALAKARG